MKEIPLTLGKTALVDDDMFDWLMQWKWCAVYNAEINNYYAVTWLGHRPTRKMAYMHRLVLNAPRGVMTDHWNQNTLENTRANLRLCNNSQNQHNVGLSVKNTSGLKGIQITPRGRWLARIRVNGRLIYLGTYDAPELAAAAYDSAAMRYFGEFALTNAMMGTL